MWLGQQSGKGGVHALSKEPGARSRLERPGTGCLSNPDAELVCGRESFPARLSPRPCSGHWEARGRVLPGLRRCSGAFLTVVRWTYGLYRNPGDTMPSQCESQKGPLGVRDLEISGGW